MTFLAVTVLLSTYVLGVGRRWIAPVLGVGVAALLVGTAAANGVPLATARADLAVQVRRSRASPAPSWPCTGEHTRWRPGRALR